MKLRGVQFGEYRTADDWNLTMNEKTIAPPTPKTNYVSVPGRDGDLDFTAALNGVVHYQSRAASFVFIATEGTHAERVELITKIIGALHGKQLKIIDLDDYPDHYMTGRLSVVDVESNNAYSVIKINAVCDPWRYANHDTVKKVTVSNSTRVVLLSNRGYKFINPTVTVEGSGSSVTLTYGTTSKLLTAGSYKFPDFRFSPGVNSITVSGTGDVTISFREAIF
jgi:phage-related protein